QFGTSSSWSIQTMRNSLVKKAIASGKKLAARTSTLITAVIMVVMTINPAVYGQGYSMRSGRYSTPSYYSPPPPPGPAAPPFLDAQPPSAPSAPLAPDPPTPRWWQKPKPKPAPVRPSTPPATVRQKATTPADLLRDPAIQREYLLPFQKDS